MPEIEKQSLWFLCSASLFRIGLALETFEEVRPLGVQVSDYFFMLSLLFLLCCRERLLVKFGRSGVFLPALFMLLGGALSSVIGSGLSPAAASLTRLFILFGLFAPLAVVHSQDMRKNMIFLMGGVFTNCLIAGFSAWVVPGFTEALAINPVTSTELGESLGRFQGLAGHPNILGLSAALAVLMGVGMLVSEKDRYMRWGLCLHILVCTVGAFLTGSRTFFVSLVPGLFVLAAMWKPNRRLLVRGVLSAIVLAGGVNYLAPELIAHYTDRLGETSADDSENSSRLLTATAALAEISQKPITGWGADRMGEAGMMFIPDAGDFIGAHVSFLQYWYATGLLGALGFLALFVLPVRRMIRALKSAASGASASMLQLGLAVYLLLFIASNLHPILFNRFLYVPLFMFAGLPAQIPSPARTRKPVRRATVRLQAQNQTTSA